MASLDVKDGNNVKAGSLDLDDRVFGEKPKTHAVYEEVKRYLASLRAGTHATKTRAEVSGAGRKLWKQKGTGRARVGSIRSPLWRKGGTTHGPQPHDHDLDIPRKVKKLAMRVALSQKLRSNELVVLERLELPEPRTRHVADLVERLDLRGETLFVEDTANSGFARAARNHPRVRVVGPTALSVYDVLHCRSLVLTRATAARLTEIFRP